MTDPNQDEADALNRTGEEPAVESGAGYGDHAPAPEDEREDETKAS